MKRELTPFDTGEIAEPQLYDYTDEKTLEWGKIDFEDDESRTLCTVQVRRVDGAYQLHLWGAEAMEIIVHDGSAWLSTTTEEKE